MSNKLSKVMALAAITAAVGAWTSQAHATLTYFLADASDPLKTAFTPTADGSVALGLYVKTDALTSSSFVIGGGSFVVTNLTTGSLATGSFAAPVLETSVNAPGSQIGASYTSSAFTGFTNWGSVNETTKDGYFYANSTSAANIGTTIPVGGSLKLGTVNFSFTGLEVGNAISLNFVPRERTGTNDQIWFEDSVAKNDTTATANAGTDITITKTNAGSGINVGAGLTVQLPETTGTRQTAAVLTTTDSVTIGAGGKLDITNNDLLIHNGDLAQVTSWLASGYNAGAWDGAGINSSTTAAQGGLTVVGVLSGVEYKNFLADFDGTAVADTDVLVKYTYAGDLNLDGIVDDNDLFAFLTNYSLDGPTSGVTYGGGDITFDGIVDDNDLFAFLANYPSADVGLTPLHATAPVPEPASLSLLALGGLFMMSRRRK